MNKKLENQQAKNWERYVPVFNSEHCLEPNKLDEKLDQKLEN
jgi:hypothetical protein